MRQTNFLQSLLTESRSSVKEFLKRQSTKNKIVQAAFGLSLLILLTMFFALRPSVVTNAQEQKSARLPETASLSEAEAAGNLNQTSPVNADDNVNTPEGSVCGWTAGTVYPIPILDQPTTVAGSNIYSFSGVSTALVTNSYKFDGTTWTAIANLPVALEFPGAASDGTSPYIMGGVIAGTGTVNTLYRYNPGTNTYTTLAPSASATSTWNHATAYLNGKIYKIGGFNTVSTTTTDVNAVEIYDIASNTWTTGANYPIAQGFMSAFVRGNFIYVAGGTKTDGTESTKTYRYDPVANAWDDASIADLPATRWGAASSQVGYGVGGGWVLAGGFVTTTLSNTVIRWDPTTNVWSALPNLLQARGRMTGAVLGSSFYVIGGRSSAGGFTGTNDNQKLTCVSGVAVITNDPINITSESCGVANNAPDPGETITISLPLKNTGDTATTNLTATLQATGGVTNPTPASQNYGAIAPGGAAVSRNFTFTVDPNLPCGSNVTLTFTVSDGGTNYTNITKTYSTGASSVSLTEKFDGVTAPALPTGWTSVQTSGTAISWVTTTTTPSSAPNAAFGNEVATVNAAALVSPAVTISSASAQIAFKNKFNLEDSTTAGTAYDGTVLEYSTNGGTTWTDVITGGGSFVSGGYTDTISTNFSSPIAGRMAWSGDSGGYIDTVINLPASLNGQSVQFRWLTATDTSAVAATGAPGSWVDDVQVLGGRTCQSCAGPGACRIQRRSDFNGDGKTDYSVFRPTSGTWFTLPNGGGSATGFNFGASSDKLQPADYDNDGKTDYGVYRGGVWYWVRSSDNTVQSFSFGAASDIPVVGDYTGDGNADLAVYRPATGVWYVRNTANGALTATQWGGDATDVPVVGDFDGDCKIDFAVRRTTNDPSTGATQFYILRSTAGATNVKWGTSAMATAIGDYDGDGKSDVGVAEVRNGLMYWYVLGATNTVLVNGVQFGQTGDVVTAGDYDGDAKTDLSVWRSSNGVFYYRAVGNAAQFGQTFGANGDVPSARAYQYPLP